MFLYDSNDEGNLHMTKFIKRQIIKKLIICHLSFHLIDKQVRKKRITT